MRSRTGIATVLAASLAVLSSMVGFDMDSGTAMKLSFAVLFAIAWNVWRRK